MSILTKEQIKRFVATFTEQETEQYHHSLGRFVAVFSTIEATLQVTLWRLAGVPSPTAQAVFSGIRTDGTMQ
jgi:hypothetical protein